MTRHAAPESIDINCDMGEGYGVYRVGNDAALLPEISSANIACGFHAGDPSTIRRTVAMAADHSVAIGAHPGFADLQGFGRREMACSAQEAYDLVVYQISAIAGFARTAGRRMTHVKAHGALYNQAVRDEKLAQAIAQAVRDVDSSLILFGLAGSLQIDVAIGMGLAVAREAFVDRTYQDDGSLTPRRQPGSVIVDEAQAMAQAVRMVRDGCVTSVNGREIAIEVDTLCLHGDQPGALSFARTLKKTLASNGVQVAALSGKPRRPQ